MIKTHEDLLKKLHNIESERFDVFEGKGLNFTIEAEARDKMFRILNIGLSYVVEEVLNYSCCTVRKGQRHPVLETKELAILNTPQEVYDYFKPFMR
jgi:hypothetical protein